MERESSLQYFSPFPFAGLRDMREVESELLKPCGRFHSPLRFDERLREKVSSMFRSWSMVDDYTVMTASNIPLQWQVLLSYLQQKNISRDAKFRELSFRNDRPKVCALVVDAVSGVEHTDGRDVARRGFGAGATLEETMSKAIGELLERHLLTVYRRGELRTANYRALIDADQDALDVTQLNSYERHQASWSDGDIREKQFNWVRGTNMITGGRAYIPAQLVFWNYSPDQAIEEIALADTTTSGSGGHFTREEAILSALSEAIQRDGFFMYWLNSIAPRRLDVARLESPELSRLLGYAARYGISAYFLNTTSDIKVPSVTCVLVDETGKEPMLAVGAGTGFNVEQCLVASIREALSVSMDAAKFPAYSLPDRYVPFSGKKIGRTERLALWRGRRMLDDFSFFLKGELQDPRELVVSTAPTSPREELQAALRELAALGKGYEPYIYDVDHEVLDTLGYHVVRAVVPKLFPLYLNESMATLDSERLRSVPGKLGYASAKVLNPLPHPFP